MHLIVIMTFALDDFDLTIRDFIHDSIDFVNSSAPITAEFILEWLGLSDSVISIAIYVLQQLENTFKCFLVLFLSVGEVIPCLF